MKKLIQLIFLGLLTVSAAAHSASLKGGYGACISEELFDQFTRAVVSKDENALNYLLKNGCFITKAGISISILDTTWTGITKVRAYAGDEAFVLWTYTENIVR